MQVLTSTGWQLFTSTQTYSVLSNSNLCWANGTYNFHVHVANHDWHAHTPSP